MLKKRRYGSVLLVFITKRIIKKENQRSLFITNFLSVFLNEESRNSQNDIAVTFQFRG